MAKKTSASDRVDARFNRIESAALKSELAAVEKSIKAEREPKKRAALLKEGRELADKLRKLGS